MWEIYWFLELAQCPAGSAVELPDGSIAYVAGESSDEQQTAASFTTTVNLNLQEGDTSQLAQVSSTSCFTDCRK